MNKREPNGEDFTYRMCHTALHGPVHFVFYMRYLVKLEL